MFVHRRYLLCGLHASLVVGQAMLTSCNYGEAECQPGARCQVCAAGGCSCVWGEWCETDGDCFVGCDDPGGCTTFRCEHLSGKTWGACVEEDWPRGYGECPRSSTTCPATQVRASFDGTIYCLDRCASHDDCATCCGRIDDGSQVCAPTLARCGDVTPRSDAGPPPDTCRVANACVVSTSRTRGPGGFCTDEQLGFIQNNCAVDVQCRHCFDNGIDRDCGLSTRIRAGEMTGGEWGGIWSCTVTDGAFVARCSHADDPSSCVDF